MVSLTGLISSIRLDKHTNTLFVRPCGHVVEVTRMVDNYAEHMVYRDSRCCSIFVACLVTLPLRRQGLNDSLYVVLCICGEGTEMQMSCRLEQRGGVRFLLRGVLPGGSCPRSRSG